MTDMREPSDRHDNTAATVSAVERARRDFGDSKVVTAALDELEGERDRYREALERIAVSELDEDYADVELRRAARRALSPDGTEAGWVKEQLYA